MNRLLPIALLAIAIVPAAAGQAAIHDLFDRVDSASLGSNWTEQDGDARILGSQLQANSPSSYGWASNNVFSANYAGVVLSAKWAMNGGGGDRVSLIAGVNPSNWSGIEVRIADNNGDGLADRIFFNAAVNAGAWYASPSFVNLLTPLASGEATMWFSNNGDTVNLALRNPATGNTEYVAASGILASPPTGVRVGVGYFGNGYIDDFRAWVGSPMGPVYTSSALRANQPAELIVTVAVAGAPVILGLSTTGAGPIPTPIGIVGLSDPILELATVVADAQGRVVLPLGVIPPSAAGATVYTQALDLATPALTNHFAVTIL